MLASCIFIYLRPPKAYFYDIIQQRLLCKNVCQTENDKSYCHVKCNRYFLTSRSFDMVLHHIHIADLFPTPTSRSKRHAMFAAAPHLEAFHSAPHPYHHPTKGILNS